MKFCPKCGNLMIASKNGRVGYLCRKCGYFVKEKGIVSTSISEKPMGEDEKIRVMKAGEDLEQYPKTKAICSNCGHNEAYWCLQQTRGGDEPQTKFLCCTKCKYKWREY